MANQEPKDLSVRLSDNLVKDAPIWMGNRLDGTIHPALNASIPGINYDRDMERYVSAYEGAELDLKKIYREAHNKKAWLTECIKEHNKIAQKKGKPAITLSENSSWNETISMYAKSIEESRNRDTKGFKGFFRKKVTQASEKSSTFQTWLQLLPKDSHYLSVLCGGLQLALGAGKRMAEIREAIHGIFDELSSLESGNSWIAEHHMLFHDSKEIHECSSNLYVAILHALGQIVEMYSQGDAHRFGSAFFKQGNSKTTVLDSISQVSIHCSRFEKQAKICSDKRQKRIEEQQRIGITYAIEAQSRNQQKFDTLHTSNAIMSQQNKVIFQKLQEIEAHQKLKLQEMEARQNVLNKTLLFLKAHPPVFVLPEQRTQSLEVGSDGHNTYIVSRSPSPVPVYQSHQIIQRQHLEALLAGLNVDRDTDVASKDALQLQNLVFQLKPRSQNVVVSFIRSPRLQSWITSARPGSLLVNGNIFHEMVQQSPLSYVSNRLAEGLLQAKSKQNVIVIRWFCGYHTDVRVDYDAHPIGMLNNFIAQLIRQIEKLSPSPQLDLSLVHSSLNIHQDIHGLCKLFESLIGALPKEAIVFCIVDGVSSYENDDRQMECVQAVSTLQMLARQHEIAEYGCLFKLLVTAPLRAHAVHELFNESETLNLEGSTPGNQTFTLGQWGQYMGQTLQ